MLQIQKKITKVNRTKLANKENKYIVIHYTGNNGDTAKGNCNYFENANRQASAHYFVDENSIWQCVEDYDAAWHVGGAKKYYSECRNNNSIGIELCSRINADGKFFIKEETIKNAQNLIAYLMTKYNISSENVIRHYDVTHKICPEPFVRNKENWLKFKDSFTWIDDLNYLEEKGRVTSDEKWVVRQIDEISELKYIFMKWADDVRKSNR